jgi:hypothetical protein
VLKLVFPSDCVKATWRWSIQSGADIAPPRDAIFGRSLRCLPSMPISVTPTCSLPAVASTRAIHVPSGELRGRLNELCGRRAMMRSPEPSAAAMPTDVVLPVLSIDQRAKTTFLPSGSQSPPTASPTIRRGAPPTTGMRNSDVDPPSSCAKRSCESSGE